MLKDIHDKNSVAYFWSTNFSLLFTYFFFFKIKAILWFFWTKVFTHCWQQHDKEKLQAYEASLSCKQPKNSSYLLIWLLLSHTWGHHWDMSGQRICSVVVVVWRVSSSLIHALLNSRGLPLSTMRSGKKDKKILISATFRHTWFSKIHSYMK